MLRASPVRFQRGGLTREKRVEHLAAELDSMGDDVEESEGGGWRMSDSASQISLKTMFGLFAQGSESEAADDPSDTLAVEG